MGKQYFPDITERGRRRYNNTDNDNSCVGFLIAIMIVGALIFLILYIFIGG